MPVIHQFVAGFANGDAISNEALRMRDIFRSWACPSEIFCEPACVLPKLKKEARDISSYSETARKDDIGLLHLSMGSDVNDLFASFPCRKVILYHNITPSHYFNAINAQTAYRLMRGRKQVKELAGVADINIADSRFNAAELKEMGYRNPGILPILMNPSTPSPAKQRRKSEHPFADGKTNILFVGRCAPNKKLEDILTTFFYFHTFLNPHSRLIYAGSYAGTERYLYILKARARELGLDNVHFLGSVPQPYLEALYQDAQVFLCMSEHEGFCIPLLESMIRDVPVVAYAASAVPETMDGAGILFREKNFALVAEMIHRITTDTTLRDAVILRQRQRISRYYDRDLSAELEALLKPLMETCSTR